MTNTTTTATATATITKHTKGMDLSCLWAIDTEELLNLAGEAADDTGRTIVQKVLAHEGLSLDDVLSDKDSESVERQELAQIAQKYVDLINESFWAIEVQDNVDSLICDLQESTGLEFEGISTNLNGNTCNEENELSADFTYAIIDFNGDAEWYYSDNVVVLTNLHRGGDPRGNYNPVECREGGGRAEEGFLDWRLNLAASTNDGDDVTEDVFQGYSYECQHRCIELLVQGGRNNYQYDVLAIDLLDIGIDAVLCRSIEIGETVAVSAHHNTVGVVRI